jgi:serine/threonine protein kinase
LPNKRLVYEREFSQRDLGGTPLYLSPEQRKLNEKIENTNSRLKQFIKLPREKVDIYSAGLVLFEMCGQFKTQMERYINLDNLSKRREFPKGFTDKYYQESIIISLMTENLPEKRPSAEQYLNKSPEL